MPCLHNFGAIAFAADSRVRATLRQMYLIDVITRSASRRAE